MNDPMETMGGNLGAANDDAECGIFGLESDPFTGDCVDRSAEE